MTNAARVILIDSGDGRGTLLAERLAMQGYAVDVARGPAEGARLALSQPPAAVVADLWMPSISGVQLCRLLRAEPATQDVPVILLGPAGQRDRFWAERAGAAAYVVKGRMGDLARALARSIAQAPDGGGFFTQLAEGDVDIRDRIASYLDAALFDSVLAGEVRALGACGEFARMFDQFSQFLTQVCTYRWMAVATHAPARLALHCHPAMRETAEREARLALGITTDVAVFRVEDEDALAVGSGDAPVVASVPFVNETIGRMAVGLPQHDASDARVVEVVARELGAAIRMVTLVEESQRLATIDALTGLVNRRAFAPSLDIEVAKAERHGWPLSVLLFDVDHFKSINDQHGHATGDVVLAAVGRLLASQARRTDVAARWGGEEFVVLLSGSGAEGGLIAGERMRAAIAALTVRDARGDRIAVTASVGVATYAPGATGATLIELADQAMYRAKAAGRNRVCAALREMGVASALEAPRALA